MVLNINLSGQGMPLVLFHGWGFDQQVWRTLTAAIGKQFCVYGVDLPGFGHSPMMDWDSFKTQLLQQLPPRFALAGWSMGGLYAMRLALEASSSVTHLLNIASSPCFLKKIDWPGIEPRVLDKFFTELTHDPLRVRNAFIALQTGQHVIQTDSDYSPSAAGLRNGFDILAQWDLRDPLQHLELPTCFMLGRLDAIIPRTTLAVMKARYPRFQYVMFQKAAHMPFMTHQDAFIDELQRFTGVV